jgi:flavin reductase (DIM6/NTAB) family NADH-FMN oxidoreductase RutF
LEQAELEQPEPAQAEPGRAELGQAYRTAISRFATGVSVIATCTPEGLVGMTASAVASLSLDPLQLLVCIANHLPTCEAIKDSGRFTVNVLAHDDEELALHFATRQHDKFASVAYRERQGLPLLDRAIANFACDVSQAVPGGDHTIFVGDVLFCHSEDGRSPLVYFDRTFGTVSRPKLNPHGEPARPEDSRRVLK